MKRVEFEITGEGGQSLREPGFVDHCSDLPLAIMRAVEDYLDAHEGKLDLPITIKVRPTPSSLTC
jgi:hypothetical protein